MRMWTGWCRTATPGPGCGATARSQLLGCARATQLRADGVADDRLQRRLMPAFRTRAEMRLDDGPLVGGRLAIDVGRKERIDLPATRHWYCL